MAEKETLPPIDPKTTALLVMDDQATILDWLGDAELLLARAGEAIRIARARGALVGYVRVGFDDADYDAVPRHSMFAPFLKARGKKLHSDAPSTAVHGNIAPRPGDIVVRKTRVSAFSTTDLDRQLKERGIGTLLLAGLLTSGVVLSTVSDAADRDYRVFVVADASADRELYVHQFLIDKILPMHAKVVNVTDLDGLLSA
jgi:nicotinamidase-related amidase